MLRAAGLLIFRTSELGIQYLLLQASYGDHHWTPPKGHVDPGEDDWTTALRETKEEAGYDENDLEIYKDKYYTLNYVANKKPKTTLYWLAKLKNPNTPVILSSEHQDYKWLTFQETLEKLGFTDACEMLSKMHVEALKVA